MASLLVRNPGLPVVTWNGKSADGVQLRKACLDAGMGSLWATFQLRHPDLYQYLRDSVRFPRRGFDLKSLARHLGVKTGTRVVDGLDTVSLWRQYRKAPRSKRSAAIRGDLTRYNTQDVSTLVSLTERVRVLAVPQAT